MVSQELLHATEQLSGLPVAEFFPTDQLLELALLRGRGTLDKFSLEPIVGVLCRGTEEEVPHFSGKFRREGADHVFETGLLSGNTASSELRFDLYKPNFRVRGPEGWELYADGRDG